MFKKKAPAILFIDLISQANRWSFKLSLLDLKKSLLDLKKEQPIEYIKQISIVFFFLNAVELWWESDCCLMPNEQFFSYIMARTSILNHEWDDNDFLDMLLHSDTLSWFPTNGYFFLHLTAVCLGALEFCMWIFDQVSRELSHEHFYQGWFQLA